MRYAILLIEGPKDYYPELVLACAGLCLLLGLLCACWLLRTRHKPDVQVYIIESEEFDPLIHCPRCGQLFCDCGMI